MPCRQLIRVRFNTTSLSLLIGYTSEERIDLRTRALRFDIPLLTQRLAGATAWVLGQEALGGMPIGYFGASTGAAAALAASCERPEVVAVVSRTTVPFNPPLVTCTLLLVVAMVMAGMSGIFFISAMAAAVNASVENSTAYFVLRLIRRQSSSNSGVS